MKSKHFPRTLFAANILLVVILAACSGGATPASQDAPPVDQAEAAAQTSAPADADEPLAEAAQPVTETAASLPDVEIVESTATGVPEENGKLYDGIPQGVTEDGFPYLGQPDSPVTLIDYSDFL